MSVVSMRQRVFYSMQKFPKHSVGSQNNGSVRFGPMWSTLNWTEICRSIFTNRFTALLLFSTSYLCREFWKEIKLVRAIPLGWPGFFGNCCSFSTGSPDLSVWFKESKHWGIWIIVALIYSATTHTSTLRLVVLHSCLSISTTGSPSPWQRMILSMSWTQGLADGSSLIKTNKIKTELKKFIPWSLYQQRFDFDTYFSSVAASTGHICNRVARQSSWKSERLSFRRASNSWCLLASLSMSSGVSCTRMRIWH